MRLAAAMTALLFDCLRPSPGCQTHRTQYYIKTLILHELLIHFHAKFRKKLGCQLPVRCECQAAMQSACSASQPDCWADLDHTRCGPRQYLISNRFNCWMRFMCTFLGYLQTFLPLQSPLLPQKPIQNRVSVPHAYKNLLLRKSVSIIEHIIPF